MRIKTGQRIAGFDARAIRDLLRRSPGGFQQSWLKRELAIEEPTLRQVLRTLEVEGYLAIDASRAHGPEQWYKVTNLGRTFMRASAAEPVKRPTARDAVAAFVQRLEAINQNPRYLCKIQKAAVFGSFLTEADRIGDVDVAVEIVPKIPLKGAWVDKFVEHARNSGRCFDSFEAELDWPRREVLLALKARKRTLSIQSWYSFLHMEKTPDFRYEVLLGDPEKVRCELEQARRESSDG